MKLAKAIHILKANTMACWWPNGPYPGKQGTDWDEIEGEVNHLLLGIMRRQDISDGTPFFILDPANPESRLYDELGSAALTVRNARTAK